MPSPAASSNGKTNDQKTASGSRTNSRSRASQSCTSAASRQVRGAGGTSSGTAGVRPATASA